MILGIGTDIVKLKRIAALHKKHGSLFLSKILSPEEMELLPKNWLPFAGGRFAAKEALVKALGGREFSFSDISILNEANGKPVFGGVDIIAPIVKVSAAKLNICVSISHEQDYATAVVIIEKKP